MTHAPPVRPGDAALRRAFGTWALAAAILNITIGGSIFAMSGTLATGLGAYAPLVFLAGALLFAPIVLSFAAAGSRVTATGGPYSYIEAAFGRLPALTVAVLLWVSSIAGSGSMAAALVDQLGHVFPALNGALPRAAVIVTIYATLAALNTRGVHAGAAAVVFFALAKAVPLLLLALAAVPSMHVDHLRLGPPPTWHACAAALVLVIFAYSGIETALAPAGEVRDAERVVPRAALLGVGAVIGLYILLQWTAQGVLGPALAGDSTPLATVADTLWPGAGVVLVATAGLSLVGTLQGDLLGTSRMLYALASDGYLPQALARISARHHVPVAAIGVHAAAGALLAVLGSFERLALVSGGAFCFVYLGCCAAAWRLERLDVRGAAPPFRLPGGGFAPLIAGVGLVLLLTTLSAREWLAIAASMLLVAVLYATRRSPR